MTAIAPAEHPGSEGRNGDRAASRPGFVLGAALVVVAVVAFLAQGSFRTAEASLTSHVVGLFTSGRSTSYSSIVWFGVGTPTVSGLQITTLCSTVILVTPLMALAGLALMVRGLEIRRAVSGLIVSLAIVIACNILRYALAAFALQKWGTDGFDLVHHYIGSLLVIAGFAVAFILLLRIATGAPGRRLSTRAVAAEAEPASRPDQGEQPRQGRHL